MMRFQPSPYSHPSQWAGPQHVRLDKTGKPRTGSGGSNSGGGSGTSGGACRREGVAYWPNVDPCNRPKSALYQDDKVWANYQKTGYLEIKGGYYCAPVTGVWYVDGWDPCQPRPEGVTEKEWKDYLKTGKVPQILSYVSIPGPTNCKDAAELYKAAQDLRKLAAENPAAVEGKRIATDDEIHAMWCAMVTHKCLPDPQNLCAGPAPGDKSTVSADIETEEGFFARNRTAVIAVSAVAVLGALWFAKKKGVF